MHLGNTPADAAEEWRAQAQRLGETLECFERELDARALRRGTRLHCVVEGDAVRFAVVPWHDDLSAPAERQLLAQQCFRETYGDVAREWTVCQHTARYGAATLACALDTRLVDRLDEMAQARGLKLVSVRPSLMNAFNEVRPSIASGLFWFVSIERCTTTLLLLSDSEPVRVKRLMTSDTDLPTLLDREWFTLGIESPRCPVYVVRTGPSMAPATPVDASAGAWSVVELTPPLSEATLSA
jgi:hypothetical protein